MRQMVFTLVLLCLLPGMSLAEDISIAVIPRDLAAYESFVSEKGGDPLSITNFSSKYSTRLVVSMVLIEQALRLGGFTDAIRYDLVPNYSRALYKVKQGESTILGQETWELEFDDTVYKSIPIVRNGEFRKAVYCRRDDEKVMNVSSLSDFSPLVALTGQGWWVDIATLQTMGVAQVMQVPEYRLHYNMVISKRADFGLVEFGGIGEKQHDLPPELAVVPGLSVGLKGSRHFMVSRNYPGGEAAYEAMQRGLAFLEAKGRIRSALLDCGFLNPTLEGWRQINP